MIRKKYVTAIFGSTGHIAKNLIYYFEKEKNVKLILFSRNKTKLLRVMKNELKIKNFIFKKYSDFSKYDYNVIINCVGNDDKKGISAPNTIKISERYDKKIIDYLQSHKATLFINFSSGAVYGEAFQHPANGKKTSQLDINRFSKRNHYSISKIILEKKHRDLNNLKIVDLRIFGFFSRFIDINDRFILSAIVKAIKNDKGMITDQHNFVRDYVDPTDLFSIIKLCMKQSFINDVFDVYSKRPITKLNMLKFLKKEFGLKYKTKNTDKKLSSTGIKLNYYSVSRRLSKLGYKPQNSSLETILNEMKFIFK